MVVGTTWLVIPLGILAQEFWHARLDYRSTTLCSTNDYLDMVSVKVPLWFLSPQL